MSHHSDKELEEQILEAGNKLLQPPSSLDELLPLLDPVRAKNGASKSSSLRRCENFMRYPNMIFREEDKVGPCFSPFLQQVESSLSKVEQSPAKSMHDALSPLMKALVTNDLLRHSDIDVKVAVASCISEITRITAPEAPYDDDKMKDVFQLIVSSFENLNDQSSRSYDKRVLILETVAKVRSCVVMLDLECDRLITEMFQHFLKAIREDHPKNIFSSMATIMTLVLEESEEVSLELLTPLLASVKKDNEEVTSIAKRLGETVFTNCAAKIKPYLPQAVESLQISLNEYNKIVNSVLEGTLPAVDSINDSAPKDQLVTESKLTELPEAAQGTQMAESVKEEACSKDIDPAVDRSPKSITSNGVSLENVGSAAETESLMKAGDHDGADLHDASKVPSKSESDDSMVEKSTKSEPKSEQTAKKRGRKNNSSINSAESSHQAPADSEKEAEKLQDHQNDRNKDDQNSASEDPAVEQSNSLENEPETIQHSASKEAVNVAPSSPGQSLPDESALKKGGRPKDSLNQEESESKKEFEATSDLEVKQVRRPLKKTHLEPCRKEKGGSTGDTEAKKQKQSGKKFDTKTKSKVGPSVRNKGDSKNRGHGKASLEAVPSQESPDHSAKHDEDNEVEIPRTTAKRKRSSVKGRESKQVVQEREPTPESPDNSAKHESDEEETPMTSAKKKRSSGKDRESKQAVQEREPTPESPDNSAKHESDEEETPMTSANKKRSSGKDRESKQVVQEREPTPESPDNSAKHESDEEETPMTSAKKKRSSGKDRVTETVQCDENLIGKKIKVWWPLDNAYYEGIVSNFDSAKKKFTVNYVDGDIEKINLSKERWQIVEDDNMSEEEQAASADAAPERHKMKKPRNAEPSAKHERMEASPKSKPKDTATKFGQKSKGKLNLKDGTSKSGGRIDDTTSNKSGAQSKKSTGKSVETEKPSARSKDVSSSTPKSKSRQDTPSTANKSKQETVKAAMKSKNKPPQNGGKPSANGTEKLKSSSSKVKESGNQKEKAIHSAKTLDSTKEKFSSASKERENESKSGKKRGRGKN
ncbi:hypothetical protein RND71_013669 [Anisodus tanguticus]|uniref:Tudor domain-containing protein n=1 Tax=Anisodus tanguticus TaxID=243964 RepID=A0AAE1S7L8_9SOLA|nr:hypothetical protein RND71_013669 [Anisodus tanguticus]